MATFEELMNQFRNPGETGLPENFADELASAYQEDLSVRDAAVAERQRLLDEAAAAHAEREKEITRLKAVNYDLLIAAPKPGEQSRDEQNDDDDSGPRGIDSLFE